MGKYQIDVVRGDGVGKLSFTSSSLSVTTDCWWDPKMVIVAGDYSVAKVHRADKDRVSKGLPQREAFWFGPRTSYNDGANVGGGAMIHAGTSAGWSKGCIVIKNDILLQIWTTVSPKDQFIVDVSISDKKAETGWKRPADHDCNPRFMSGMMTGFYG
ncbi:hypothetical protein [Oceanicola sp. 502str15]|uniref:hypothetical protein n=1 Tax=Oceanicola sp. 502str15 TaxID=2696061 RepID=UPI0020943F37|nr:hypothetical protein [Oceanicola sp. 502str15]MCO6384340.1 hypothetical protein [Oceanicola sp. 502str15]